MTQILIVEDNETLALGLRTSLEVEGYKVAAVSDGAQALDWLEGNSPDLFKITSNNKYKANLDTGSVTGLQLGLATLCVTSINTNFTSGVGTSTATATVPPACTVINLQ